MTKKEKEQWLEANKELKDYYKKYPLDERPDSYYLKTGKRCPLCAVALKIRGGSYIPTCDYCLWSKFEGKTCIARSFNLDITQKRLDRLDGWDERILKGDD